MDTQPGGNKPDTELDAGPAGRSRALPAILLTSLVWLVLAGSALWLWRRPTPVAFEIQPPPATATPRPTETPTPSPTPGPLAVDVGGAVRRPGVYELPPGSRVQQAIDAAGGVAAGADLRGLSLAALLRDGDKLYVPAEGEAAPRPASAVEEPASRSGPGIAVDSSFPLNINTATVEALQTLPGIGPKIAQAIADHRQANGPFTTIEEIVQVKGIGEATLAKLRELITVD
jgi:competence protein ComEA